MRVGAEEILVLEDQVAVVRVGHLAQPELRGQLILGVEVERDGYLMHLLETLVGLVS
jgi:hypothetical protein